MAGKKPVLFYGVNSEGMGHATRSLTMIQALSQRYEVHVFCGGRIHRFMRQHCQHVHLVWFGKLIYRNNRADVRQTVFWSFMQGPYVLLSGAYVTLLALLMRPVACISDFECLTAWAGMLTLGKVITLDNQMLIKHGALPEPEPHQVKTARVVRRVLFWNTPVVHRALITSFYQPGLHARSSPRRARFVPVAVRPLVLSRREKVRTDGPVLVYQTSTTNLDLPGTLVAAAQASTLRFVVYGMGRTDSLADGRVVFRPFSEENFVDDLAAAPFVLMNGGHSTIAEALALGKPVLAEPVVDQYEQDVNVLGLEAMGIGRGVRKLTAQDIHNFSQDASAMREKISRINVVDNDRLLLALEETLHELNPRRALPPAPAVQSKEKTLSA